MRLRSEFTVVVTAIALYALVSACSTERTRQAEGDLELRPKRDRIDFGAVEVGSTATVQIAVWNTAMHDAPAEVVTAAPFSAGPSLVVPGGGERTITLAFRPTEEGPVEEVLRIGDALEVRLIGSGVVPASSRSNDSCDGRAEGEPCSLPCVEKGACVSGACLGDPKSCDDSDLCTDDACDPSSGCVHSTKACAEPTNPCRAGVCDPQHGCREASVPDGTVCGRAGCDVQDVCVAGACVERVPPEGATCGYPSPCQSQGACSAGVCVREPATPLRPEWSFPVMRWIQWTGHATDQGNLLSFGYRPSGNNTVAIPTLLSLHPDGGVAFEATVPKRNASFEDLVTVSGGVAVLYDDDRTRPVLHGVDAATGSALWLRDPMKELASNFRPLGTGEKRTLLLGPLLETGAGQVTFSVNVLDDAPSSLAWTSWMATLDARTGAYLRVAAGPDRIEWQLSDYEGPSVAVVDRLDAGTASVDKTRFAQIDGVLNASLAGRGPFFSEGVAAAKGRVFVQHPGPLGCNDEARMHPLIGVYDPATGAFNDTAVSPWNHSSQVAGFGRGWLVGQDFAEIDTGIPCSEREAKPQYLWSIDPDTGAADWKAELTPTTGELPFGTLLTSRGTILVGIQRGSWNGPKDFELREYGRDGTLRFACPLEVSSKGGMRDPVLVNGLWIVDVMDGLDRGEIDGFRIGLSASAFDWPMAGGNAQRTNRALPPSP